MRPWVATALIWVGLVVAVAGTFTMVIGWKTVAITGLLSGVGMMVLAVLLMCVLPPRRKTGTRRG